MFRFVTAVMATAALMVGEAGAWAAPDPRAVLAEMEAEAARLDGYRFVQLKRERFGDRLSPPETMLVKHSRGRIYLHVLAGPRKGAEAIFTPGRNGDKVRVHKGSFPDVTLNLDPHGAMLMDGQHHPIEHASLEYVVATLMRNVRRGEHDPERKMRCLGETRVGGRVADLVEISGAWKTTPYVVQKGEDAWTLGRRFGVDPYLLAHTNGMKRVDSLSAGQTIQVPLYSGSRAVIAVDRQSRLPCRLEVYDGKGELYEAYEWSQLDTRTPITDGDFDPANPAYKF